MPRRNIHGLNDPLTWGILPACMYLQFHMTRWTLGASDIMFTNPKGETFRGTGIYQPAIDTAIEKLHAGAWMRAS
ncbi:hypothetical protein EDB85DRAFT_2153177 [Lactarius pseudohatsudake]|nr:hypothetical protein EDB85DRAFT_2153177 [Lactarius pseudohatsudake]